MDTGKALKALKGSGDIGATIAAAVEVLEDYENIKKKRDAAEKAHQSLAARYMGLKATIERQEGILTDLEGKIASLKAEHDELSKGMPNLRAKAADTRAAAFEEMDKAKADAAKARGEVLEIRRELEGLKKRVMEEKVRLEKLIGAASG